ncbi:MAG: hypothetical protein FJ098_16730, partial [Deltaproteobacteria bacterium]|nr:hypothetical protein [Deltaproteobacteria bacterium]
GGAALSAKSLACTGCVVPSHLTVPYAGSATKGGPAGDLDCPACVSAAEVSFPWAAGVAPGGAALAANQAANADTLDFQDSTDFEPAGAVAAHQAGVPHLTAAEEAALTGGGVTTLHAHPASPGSGAAPARVRQTSKDVNLPPLGSTRERLHVFSAAAPKVYLYLYGETYSNMVLPNHGHGTHNHTFSQSIAGWQPASYRCGDNQCTSSTTVTVSSVTTGTGTYPLTDVSGTATPKGVQIWIDGADRTAAIGDQQGKGAPAWGGTSWGTGTAWETGRLDLSNAVDWGVGEHVLEFRETGNAGGRLSYYVYLVDPAASSAPFPNDACGGALPLAFTGGVAVVKATTEDMLGENKALDDLAPAGCGGAGGGDVVYSLTLTVRTTLHAALAAPFAGRVYVLASPCATQQVLACGTTLATTAELDPGTYFVVVDSDDPGEKGDFTLTVTQEPSPLPPNDTCATAQAMAPSGSPLVVTGTTKWGLDQYEGTCGGGAAADTVYTFQATDVNDDLSVTLTGGFAAVLVLRAQSCETGFQLSCSTN